MNKVAVTLTIAKRFLFNPETNPNGSRRICAALDTAECDGLITEQEAIKATVTIMSRLRGYAYLEWWAKNHGLIPPNVTPYSPEYVAFRDQWLDELIRQLCE